MDVTIYTFRETPCLCEDYPVPSLIVYAAHGCGREFVVGAILEPDSPNPCLLLPEPLGVFGVKQILLMLKERQSRRK